MKNKTASMLKPKPIVYGFIFIIIVCGIVYLYTQVEWKEVTIDRGYSDAAKKNPFLAAGMLLDKLNIGSYYSNKTNLLDSFLYELNPIFDENASSTRQRFSLPKKPSVERSIGKNDVMFLLDARGSLSDLRYKNILAWVEAGGTLVYETNNKFLSKAKVKDAFMDKFGVSYVYDEYFEESNLGGGKLEERNNNETEHKESENKKSTINTEGQSQLAEKMLESFQSADKVIDLSSERCEIDDNNIGFISIYSGVYGASDNNKKQKVESGSLQGFKVGGFFQSYFNLPKNNDLLINVGEVNGKTVYAEYGLGLGRIVFGSHLALWNNKNIHCLDHALHLIHLASSANKVWFIQNQNAPSLWLLLWSKAYLALVFTVVCLLFYLWRSAVRFGPIKTDYNTQRRFFSEHISAASHLVWRKEKHYFLLRSILQDVLRKSEKRQGDFDGWSAIEKIQWLSTIAELDSNNVENLFHTVGFFRDTNAGLNADLNEKNLSNTAAFIPPKISSQIFIQTIVVLKKLKERL